MENLNFQEQLENLVKSEDLIAIGREVNALKVQFEDFILEAERVQQVNQLEAQERGESYDAVDYKSHKETFYSVYKAFKETRKKQNEIKTALEK